MNYKKHVITGFKTKVKYTDILIKNLVSQKSKVQSAEMQAVLFLLQSDKHSEKMWKGVLLIRYSQIPALSTFMHILGYCKIKILHI